MSTVPVMEPVFDRDIRLVNYFNGRLLSAEDLSREQSAHLEERRRLGRAIGDGIVNGLEVVISPNGNRVTSPTIRVKPGLAIDRRGQTLYLGIEVDIPLYTRPSSSPSVNTSSIRTFEDCRPSSEGVPYVAGAGMYMLTIGGVEGGEGRAMAGGLGTIEASCNTRYTVPGVRFRLINLPIPDADLSQPDLLRNRFAYRCFTGENSADDAFYTNPFGAQPDTYGLVDDLRPTLLQDCEVPLALIYLTTSGGIVFIDMWAVRRRVIEPNAATHFPLLTGDRRRAEAEAMFMQFQDHIEDIRQQQLLSLGTIVAARYFHFLPPVGMVPGGTSGFNPTVFFGSQASSEIAMLDGAEMRLLLAEARYADPIPVGGDKIQLYNIFENAKAVTDGTASVPAIVFASAALAYRGRARFGYAHWDISRFASSVI